MTQQEALELINNTHSLQSLLYDIGMMPEQLQPGMLQWTRMLAYAYAYQAGRDSVPMKEVAW
jgi:hypothetical protein